MSAATTATDAGAPPAKGKKKLIVIAAAGVLVLALIAVGALLALKKSPADEDEEEAPVAQATATKAHDPKNPPVFAPLEAFTVNLADKEGDRYAQVGITLELASPETAEMLKTYLPAVRNNVLLLLASKTAAELLEADGKTTLAREVQREASRALGAPVTGDEDAEATEGGAKKKRKKKAEPALPVSAVYFSTFIIQ